MRGYVWLAADPGPVIYFSELGRWENLAHDAMNAVVLWIGDALIVCLFIQHYLSTFDSSNFPDLSVFPDMGQESLYNHFAYNLACWQYWFVLIAFCSSRFN